MGKRRIVWALSCLVLALVACAASAAQRDITFVTLDREGFRDIEVTTPLARIILSEQGGVLKSVFLSFAPYGSNVAELVPGTTTNVKTFGRQYVANAIFPFAVSVNGEREGLYRLVDAAVDESTGVFHATFQGSVAGVSIEKRYTISPVAIYTVDFELSVKNPATAAAQIEMTVGDYVQKTGGLEITYLFDDQPGTQLLARESYQAFGGVGLMDKQTVFFVAPKEGAATVPTFERTASGSQHFGYSFSANPQAETKSKSVLYAGRRRFLLMQEAGIQALDRPGVGAKVMIPVIQFVDLLFRATGNYGWAIILFTILTRLLLWPLMNKQMHSMAKLQRLQPKMKRIQERFKDDKALLQQRLMELYKKEGINPMSGCLPMVIQLPIIFVIWRAILYAGERIHLSPGFLWMPDLSLYDPYFVLVVLTTAIMIWQQWKLTPQTASDGAPGTKYFGYVFPVLMAILLWKFPAGLWLYYLLTTAAQAAQQAIVNQQLARADRLAAATSEGDLELGDGDEDGRNPQGG
ncbi:MAG: membrane protein insertase YidC [Candidatus Bipolaricaulota bacterium]|nr:membrane protein insertase YidC [Candidatus Bipolaricaulota bacterium]